MIILESQVLTKLKKLYTLLKLLGMDHLQYFDWFFDVGLTNHGPQFSRKWTDFNPCTQEVN